MMTPETAVSFAIDTEVTAAYFDHLLNFIHQQYILPHQERFANGKRAMVDHDFVLSFTVLVLAVNVYVDIEMRAG